MQCPNLREHYNLMPSLSAPPPRHPTFCISTFPLTCAIGSSLPNPSGDASLHVTRVDHCLPMSPTSKGAIPIKQRHSRLQLSHSRMCPSPRSILQSHDAAFLFHKVGLWIALSRVRLRLFALMLKLSRVRLRLRALTLQLSRLRLRLRALTWQALSSSDVQRFWTFTLESPALHGSGVSPLHPSGTHARKNYKLY